MSRAEITRIFVPSARSVNVMCRRRPLPVLPNAWKRGSTRLWERSSKTSNGSLKKTCSASAADTPCASFFLALPGSQSKPEMRARSITFCILASYTKQTGAVRLLRALCERHGQREYWLIHPVDLIVTAHRLVDGAYGKPDIHELKDTLACGILPEVVIDWARVVREA